MIFKKKILMILGRYPSNTLYHEKKTNGLYEKHNAHLHRHYTFHKACQLFTLCKVSFGYTRKNCIVFIKKITWHNTHQCTKVNQHLPITKDEWYVVHETLFHCIPFLQLIRVVSYVLTIHSISLPSSHQVKVDACGWFVV